MTVLFRTNHLIIRRCVYWCRPTDCVYWCRPTD